MATLYAGGPTLNSDASFTVRSGDSLSLYSQGLYGDFTHINEFYRSNGNPPRTITDKSRISVGERLWHLANGHPRAGTPNAAQQTALHLIDQFEKRTARAFVNIDRMEVADGLRQRVMDPRQIDQGRAGLCPSASVVYIEAKSDPVRYVVFVTELYERGVSRLRNWKVEAGWFLRHYDPPAYVSDRASVHVADWIPMASIRDSENWLLPYADTDWINSGAYPFEIVNWLRKAGYTSVVDRTRLLTCETQQNLRHASYLLASGYKVILAIDANVFRSFEDRSRLRRAHVVVLTKPVVFRHSAVEVTVYTWRSERIIKPDGNLGLTLSDFLNHYYGFIAARL